MKKLLGTALILISTLFIGYSQQDNNTTDDAYYNDNNDNGMIGPQVNQQNDYDDENNDNGGPSYQTFYDQLSPYGNWINYPGYGYCWVPNQVDPDFSPYMTNGHWVYTDLGWTWVSDYPWGWGPFHYGRWFEDPSYGWIWLPGYNWAPAWVIWGDYDGYYGWACIGPRDVLSPHYRPDPRHWHFVQHQYMGREDFGRHIERNDVVAHNINEINSHINIIAHANTYNQSVFFGGPKASEVEKYSGQKIARVQINNVTAPAQTKVTGNQVNIYRPNIIRSDAQHNQPNKVVNTQDLKPNRSEPAVHNNNVQPERQQPVQQQPAQQWTPPRQSPQQHQNYTPAQQPQRQNVPAQQPQRQFNAPAQQPVQRTFVPSERPAAPVQQQHYSAPQQHFSAPASAPRGGGRR